jgi:hypothetical protein
MVDLILSTILSISKEEMKDGGTHSIVIQLTLHLLELEAAYSPEMN